MCLRFSFALRQLHRASGKYGRNGLLVDYLRLTGSGEFDRVDVEVGDAALELDAIHKEDRDRHGLRTHMFEKHVLEGLRALVSHYQLCSGRAEA